MFDSVIVYWMLSLRFVINHLVLIVGRNQSSFVFRETVTYTVMVIEILTKIKSTQYNWLVALSNQLNFSEIPSEYFNCNRTLRANGIQIDLVSMIHYTLQNIKILQFPVPILPRLYPFSPYLNYIRIYTSKSDNNSN